MASRVPARLAPADLLKGGSNGLNVQDGLPYNEWLILGRRIATIADASGWWLGDWLLYGQQAYGSRYKAAIVATTLDYQTLRNCAWVAHKFDPPRRVENLSFNHHAEVASLPEPDQDLWLRRAERFGWSRNELRRQVTTARTLRCGRVDSELAVTVSVPVKFDREQRWREAASACGRGLGDWIAAVLDAAAEALLVAPEPIPDRCFIDVGAVGGDVPPSRVTPRVR